MLGFIIACTILTLVESSRFGNNVYPKVPASNKRDIASLGFSELSDEGPSRSISLKGIGAALKPLQGYVSVGVAFLALMKLAQERGLLDSPFVFSKFGAVTADAKKEDDPVIQLKKDQDEVWSAILNIHNTQKDSKALMDAASESISELRDAQSRFAAQYQQKVDEITSRLSDIDQSILELSQNVLELTQSVDTKELREQLHSVEDRLQRESVATTASVRQVREELPELMQKHDHMVTEKLSRFKDDLKQLLSKRQTSAVDESPAVSKGKKKQNTKQ